MTNALEVITGTHGPLSPELHAEPLEAQASHFGAHPRHTSPLVVAPHASDVARAARGDLPPCVELPSAGRLRDGRVSRGPLRRVPGGREDERRILHRAARVSLLIRLPPAGPRHLAAPIANCHPPERTSSDGAQRETRERRFGARRRVGRRAPSKTSPIARGDPPGAPSQRPEARRRTASRHARG
jgi:hypothetical protein